MCLAVPAKVVEIRENGLGLVDHAGNQLEVSLMLLDEPAVGDYVIVHAGFAIHKIDEAAAQETIEYLRALAVAGDLE